ncbi:MAG: YlxR family protein [Anaerolineae bacterium]|nr:YlxR family protein [Anaerolineae bacterium]
MRHKHIPQRSCVVCRQVRPKRELTRLVSSPEAGIQIDTSGKAPGRGAYLCSNPTCWKKAAYSDLLSKALRIALTEQDRVRLSAYVTQLAPNLQPNHD